MKRLIPILLLASCHGTTAEDVDYCETVTYEMTGKEVGALVGWCEEDGGLMYLRINEVKYTAICANGPQISNRLGYHNIIRDCEELKQIEEE